MTPEKEPSHSGVETYDQSRLKVLLNSPLILQSEVMSTRDGGIVDCWVPTHLIDHEEVPVKEEWAQSLATEMREIAATKGGTGQLSPVLLGLINGEDSLKIMDGFHRDAALKLNDEEKIFSAVQLTDWDGLYDVRIFTAKDHAHVRFSRVVQWIREVWAHSGLDDQMTVEQAILLYRYDNPGSKLGLDQEAVQEAKEWVARKERQWGMAAMTIHSHLKVAENVDPDLVHAARENKRGESIVAPTQAILKIFADQLSQDFDLQKLVMERVRGHKLSGPQVKGLCERVAGHTLDEARVIIDRTDLEELKPSYGKSQQRALRRAHDTRHKGAKVFNRAGWEIQSVLRRARLSTERKEEVNSAMRGNIREAIDRARELQSELGKVAVELGNLLGEEPTPKTPEKTVNTIREPENTATLENEEGLRLDIINYLSGEADLNSVHGFSPRQLTDCFREIEGRKEKPDGWRDRFILVQQANAKGQLL